MAELQGDGRAGLNLFRGQPTGRAVSTMSMGNSLAMIKLATDWITEGSRKWDAKGKDANRTGRRGIGNKPTPGITRFPAEPFRDFLFAAVHTGLRPFCELARLTADMVIDSDRGMMWKVFSSKTKKTRKVPVLPQVAELTRKLMTTAPPGSGMPLFRTPQGNAWKKVTGVISEPSPHETEGEIGLARAEFWAPLWQCPATLAEVRSLLQRGLARLAMRPPVVVGRMPA